MNTNMYACTPAVVRPNWLCETYKAVSIKGAKKPFIWYEHLPFTHVHTTNDEHWRKTAMLIWPSLPVKAHQLSHGCCIRNLYTYRWLVPNSVFNWEYLSYTPQRSIKTVRAVKGRWLATYTLTLRVNDQYSSVHMLVSIQSTLWFI